MKMAMDIANLVYWEYDSKKDLFTFNDQFYALYGTTADEQGGYQMPIQVYIDRFVAPEERALISAKVGNSFQTKDLSYFNSFKHWIIRSDGERRFMMVRARYMRDENGEKIAIYGASQDITEQKRAEEALAESERRMAEIINFLPDATFAIDDNGKVISWNRAIEEMTGVVSEDILGKGNYEYSIPFYKTRRPLLVDLTNSSSEEINQFYKTTRTKGEVLTSEASLTLQGDNKILKINAVPFYDSKGDYCGGIESIRDITEMKESRRKINRELEINKSLANIYVPLVSPSSTIENVGRAILNEARKLTGCSYGFASAVDSTSYDLISETLAVMMSDYQEGEFPQLDEKYAKILKQSLADCNSTFINFLNDHHSDADIPPGDRELENLLIVPVVLGDERVGQITLIDTPEDYTDDDLKAIERLAVFYALAIQNKRADEEIKQSLEDNKILLREVHHRVKNNMQIISSLLNLQINYEDEQQAVNVLKESQGRVKSMSMVHEKLYQSPSFTKIDFKNYVEQLVKDIFYSYGINNEDIEIVMDIENIEIGIDTAIPCGLIINELVTNTVKYAFPQNKGILYIKLKSVKNKIKLVIADNGIGMSEDFDFTNSDSLGLQLVNNLVTQIDGQISLDQIHGTAFTITFQELKYKKRI
ncbi:histidine kinase dimerization/phosphoacceptor domain -containing protein [Methanobacterium petrolearium]|uniref:histidine kinase dimerization/phosphoacceptor domain -containing protein n=1 Tax=Methanobacterium petrolearium TaxID=710190 RepID=UPI00308216CA